MNREVNKEIKKLSNHIYTVNVADMIMPGANKNSNIIARWIKKAGYEPLRQMDRATRKFAFRLKYTDELSKMGTTWTDAKAEQKKEAALK